jgi:hypothetical protein
VSELDTPATVNQRSAVGGGRWVGYFLGCHLVNLSSSGVITVAHAVAIPSDLGLCDHRVTAPADPPHAIPTHPAARQTPPGPCGYCLVFRHAPMLNIRDSSMAVTAIAVVHRI